MKPFLSSCSFFVGIILGSFFYGYLTTQLPGGWLACRFGGKRVLGFGVLFTAIFTLLVPVAARLSVYLFIFARILAGLSEVSHKGVAGNKFNICGMGEGTH